MKKLTKNKNNIEKNFNKFLFDSKLLDKINGTQKTENPDVNANPLVLLHTADVNKIKKDTNKGKSFFFKQSHRQNIDK